MTPPTPDHDALYHRFFSDPRLSTKFHGDTGVGDTGVRRQRDLVWRIPRREGALLLRQLERRFGAVPGWARDRVLAADTVTIEDWGLRVLEAANLEAVLG